MITKHIIINGSMDGVMVNSFLEQINQYYFDSVGVIQQPKFCIYLTSHGGLTESEYVIVNAINSDPERFKIIANGEICSSAFSLFFSTNCDKTIFPGTYGMYHLSRMAIEVSQNGIGHFEGDRFHLKHFTQEAKENLQWCESIGMNAQEIEAIATNTDQYFSTERLKELLDYEREKRRNAIDREAVKSIGTGESISRLVGGKEIDGANNNGCTHDNLQPVNNDSQPQSDT